MSKSSEEARQWMQQCEEENRRQWMNGMDELFLRESETNKQEEGESCR